MVYSLANEARQYKGRQTERVETKGRVCVKNVEVPRKDHRILLCYKRGRRKRVKKWR